MDKMMDFVKHNEFNLLKKEIEEIWIIKTGD